MPNLEWFGTSAPPSAWDVATCEHDWGQAPVDVKAIEFLALADQWRRETAHLSVIRTISMNSSYQKIMAMGDRALSFIFQDMRREPDHWFWALEKIAGVDPVPPEAKGDIEAETEYWLQWARSQGYSE